MKKILFFIFIFISAALSAQTGTGWGNIYYKMNLKDSVNMAKSFRIGNVWITPSATQFNYLDIASGRTGTGNLVFSNSPVFTTPNIGTATGSVSGNAGTVTNGIYVGDTATMLSKYARKLNAPLTGIPTAPTAAGGTNTTQIATTAFVFSGLSAKVNVSDTSAMLSNYLRDSGGELGVALADSSVTDEGYVTPTDLNAAIAGFSASGGNESMSPSVAALNALGMPQTIVAMPLIVTDIPWSENTNLTDSVSIWSAFYLHEGDVITGVGWLQGNQGDYTASVTGFNGFTLYSVSGTDYTKVKSSTNDGNVWKGTANTVTSKVFSSTYTVTADGLFYLMAQYNHNGTEGGAPSVYAHSATLSTLNDAILSNRFSGDCNLTGAYTATPPTSYAAGGDGQNAITDCVVAWGFWLY